jgi:DNA-binding transcriptional ArsR family regulator
MLAEKEIQKNRNIFSESDKNMVVVFKVLSDINRYRIFRLLLVQQLKLSIGDIAQILHISLPLASQHIRVLTHINLIKKERYGKMVFPQLEHENPFAQAVVKTIQEASKSNA